MFKSKKELAFALLEGRKFKIEVGEVYFDDGFKYKSEAGITNMISAWDYYDKVVEIKEWYEDIPENGRLCRVWGGSITRTNARILVVKSYNKNIAYHFKTNFDGCWTHAEPLTNNEIKEFLV